MRGVTPDELCHILRSTRFRWNSERDLQNGIHQVLCNLMIEFAPEHILDENNRIDFLLSNGLGIEVKIAGGRPAVFAQLQRYAGFPEVTSLVLVTGRTQLASLPAKVNGKSLRVVSLIGSLV